MTEFTPVRAREVAEALVPREAIFKGLRGAWCVTLMDVELAVLLTNAVSQSPSILPEVLDGMDLECREPGLQGMHVCRFYPGHANSHQDIPCDSAQRAQSLKDWFTGLGVRAELVLIIQTEQVFE